MPSVLRGKIRVLPSGLSSVIVSNIPANPSLAVVPNFGKTKKSSAGGFDSLPSGQGGLGRKEKASWKSCRGVRERMAAAELEFKVKNCALLTVTLPSVDERAFEALARYSSYAIDRLNREFKRFFKGERFARISVWEYQKRGALHCHILLASDCIHTMKNADLGDYFANVWYRVLLAVEKKFPCNILLGSDGKRWELEDLKKVVNNKDEAVFVNVQKVRKSVVAYLSKYLADSNHENKTVSKQSLREKFFPIATWFQWNRESTKLMEKYTDEFDLGYAEPDRKLEVVRILEKAKKIILENVKLAKGTEIKEPKNPYNIGLYWLPYGGGGSLSSGMVSAYCIEKLSHIFKREIKPQRPVYPKYTLASFPEYPSIEVEMAIREYEREKRRLGYLSADYSGLFIANLGIRMVAFFEKMRYILDSSKPKIYEQMELDFYA